MACLAFLDHRCICVGPVTDKPVKSIAGHVLATGEATSEEARSLAAAVLGDDSLTPGQPKTREDLQRILSKVEGREGQHERASAIRQQLANMGED